MVLFKVHGSGRQTAMAAMCEEHPLEGQLLGNRWWGVAGRDSAQALPPTPLLIRYLSACFRL